MCIDDGGGIHCDFCGTEIIPFCTEDHAWIEEIPKINDKFHICKHCGKIIDRYEEIKELNYQRY